jgi:hypothetical protein
MPEEDASKAGLTQAGSPAPDLGMRAAIVRLLHPIPLTILLILTSVLALIGADVLNLDKGRVLARMSEHEFARGLITYLFAVTTIGTSVVLVMAALTGAIDEEPYKRGKEILALLLGVFGTIVGFYFGSEAHAGQELELNLSPPYLESSTLVAGTTTPLTAYVNGGKPPYAYGYAFNDAGAIEYSGAVDANGWIKANVTAPSVTAPTQKQLVVGVQDKSGSTMTRTVTVTVRPGP